MHAKQSLLKFLIKVFKFKFSSKHCLNNTYTFFPFIYRRFNFNDRLQKGSSTKIRFNQFIISTKIRTRKCFHCPTISSTSLYRKNIKILCSTNKSNKKIYVYDCLSHVPGFFLQYIYIIYCTYCTTFSMHSGNISAKIVHLLQFTKYKKI